MIDGNGNVIASLPLTGIAGTDIPFELTIRCRSGYELSATSPSAGVVTWAKANPGDAFQNIQTTPIDLTPYADTDRTFYFETRIDEDEPAGIMILQIRNRI